MPGSNVFEKIDSERPKLAERMCQNTEVSSTVMAYLNLLVGLTLRLGKPIESVRISTPRINQNVLSANVTFFDGPSLIRPAFFSSNADLVEYAGRKAQYLADALSQNDELNRWFDEMVSAIEQWAAHKGIPFSAVKIDDPIITRGAFQLTFKLGRRLDIV